MKKILTLILSQETIESGTMPESAELLYATGEKNKGLYDAAKQAKGKYVYIPETVLTSADLQELFNELEKTNADIVAFKDGALIKAGVLKGLNAKLCESGFSALIYSVFNSKSVFSIDCKPFELEKTKAEYSNEREKDLNGIIGDFNKCKAKLPKEVYSLAFDLILQKLVEFYICAMLAIHAKKLDFSVLKEFDSRLKQNVVLSLALEKRFTCANLAKLRQKEFKIDFFTNLKFKKLV